MSNDSTNQLFKYITQDKNKALLFLIFSSIFYNSLLFAQQPTAIIEPNMKSIEKRQLEHQQAASFTHLNWVEVNAEKISLNLKPIINYSGIPIEEREEDADYFNHGKLPKIVDNIIQSAFITSRRFTLTENKADYQIELMLDNYQLPFSYSADDSWTSSVNQQVKRWMKTPAAASVKLSIKLTSGNKTITPWIDSVEMKISVCDLNQITQPQTWANNEDKISRAYLTTTPGQSFLAATNFLVLKAIQRLNQQPLLGNVTRKLGNEIYIASQSAKFTQVKVLNLFYKNDKNEKPNISAGQIKIIKTMQNSAMAYPVNLRGDHIKVGDWVEISHNVNFDKPQSNYIPVNQCAQVTVATN